MRKMLSGSVLALALAGCATAGGSGATGVATANLIDSGGRVVGDAILRQSGGGVRLRVSARGLPPGLHGIHVHAVGRCDPPDFASAGSHWNPAGRQHGRDNPQGMHQGDLPNLLAPSSDGRGRLETTIKGATSIDSILDPDGAALVIHAARDDDRTDPSGNSGARIACGVFKSG